MKRFHSQLAGLTAASALWATASHVSAQVYEVMRFETLPHHVNSGAHIGPDALLFDEFEQPNLTLAFTTFVQAPGMNLTRVHFPLGAFELGRYSEIRLTSLKDGQSQRFTHDMLVAWGGWSAIFNGDGVMVQLYVAPNEEAWFEIHEIAINDPVMIAEPGGGAESLCGADNRIASTDSRVGRLSGPNCGNNGGCGGCTAWLTSIGSAMTAGHCGNGSGGLIEFNVPMSSSSGAPSAADISDQYPVGVTWYAFQDGGPGFDWAIMSVGPNTETNLRAHWVQGYFHLSPVLPSDGTTLRITGFGVDNTPMGSQPTLCCAFDDGNCIRFGCNSSSLTLQTSTGPKSDDTTNRILYEVDSEPANSGSPVIINSSGHAVAVHTHGACASGGENSGTRLTQSTLATWLNNFINDAAFVDFQPVGGFPIGTVLNPLPTISQGISAAGGGNVVIAGGNYTAAAGNTGTFTAPATLIAASGNVTIGN